MDLTKYNVIFTETSLKKLKSLNNVDKSKIFKKITELGINPFKKRALLT